MKHATSLKAGLIAVACLATTVHFQHSLAQPATATPKSAKTPAAGSKNAAPPKPAPSNDASPAAESDTDTDYYPMSKYQITCRASKIPDTPGLSGKSAFCDSRGVCGISVGTLECARVGNDGSTRAFVEIPLASAVLVPAGELDGAFVSTLTFGMLQYSASPHGLSMRKNSAEKLAASLPK